MNESVTDETDPRIQEALRAYNSPPPVPMDEMWQAIEKAHFGATVHTLPVRRGRWIPTGLAAAAALVLGIAIGQYGPSIGNNPDEVPPSLTSPVAEASHVPSIQPMDAAYELTANRYLGQTAALLAVLPGAARIDQQDLAQQVDAHFASQAAELLSTTRMLLGSPAAKDPVMQDLLSDLELVLAQVASLSPARSPEELQLIKSAVEQHDVLPRLQQAVLRTSDLDPTASAAQRRRGLSDSM